MLRTFRLFFLLAIAGIFAFQASHAQGIVDDPTTWTFEVKKSGDNKYQLIFHLKLQQHWHIWSMTPGGDGSLVAPTFKLDNIDGVQTLGPVKEKGTRKSEVFIEGDPASNFFENSVDYVQEVRVGKNVHITGKLRYQVCDEKQCLPATGRKFFFDITDAVATNDAADTAAAIAIAGEPRDTASRNATASGTGTGTGTPDSSHLNHGSASFAGATEKTLPGASMLPVFIKGFGAGLVSVVTPCVFAMLPMTVSFFLKRSRDRKTGIRIALQYSLSIVLIFTVIGGVMSLAFGPDALHAFSTNWIVNIFFFVIFMIFGISFLGAFEINLPSSWATKLDSKANTQNFVGIFFMALTLVVVSFSCTGPFIGTLLVEVQSGGKIGPLLGFFGFGLGLALPFSLFAIFPTLLQEFGKSGGWLNAVKVTFGFIELALAMKFLSNADLTKGWRLLDREIFIGIWIVLAFTLFMYLVGIIRFSHDSELPKNDWGLPYLKVPRLFFALTALVFGMYLLPGMWGAPLRGMGAFVPPMGTFDSWLGTAAPTTSEHAGKKYNDRMKIYEPATVINLGLDVYFDYEEALAASKAAKKPVMLDFTGIACVNCRKFESEVWSKPEVMSRMKNDFVIASLYTDASEVLLPKEEQRVSASGRDIESLGDKNVDLQVTKFKSNTQPYYFFVDENGTVLADQGIAYPCKPEDFVKHLDAVKAKYKQLHP